ncbi:hypothetical protein NM688_g3350 [Phlebia brevispora]|uniref:Uncharacterized protein n=1 Tax=Phlebia brevispora TaxID=194682 RepID=A0ACC1T656_9APHY|nr:hypothetical protein NM688_g3350 [Phlebia brevispora]
MARIPCIEIINVISNEPMPCENNPEVSKPGLEAVSKAPGCLGLERTVWESLSHHHAFMADRPKYTPAEKGLTMVMKELKYLVHVYFTTEPWNALKAPLTELVLFTLKDGAKREEFVPVLATLVTAMNATPEEQGATGGAAWGPVKENTRQYVVIAGWKDMESWENISNLPSSTELLAQLREHAEMEAKHIQFFNRTPGRALHIYPTSSRALKLEEKMAPKALKTFTEEEVAKHNKEGDLWIIVDSKVYDLSKFADLHPGGAGVLYTSNIAGKDATKAFFGLHRHEVLLRPQYARLQIGTIEGQTEVVKADAADSLSGVPYAEPSWLSKGYYSPYYKDSHRRFQKAVRKFVMEVVYPDALRCEDNGKRISQDVVDKLCEMNIPAMRLGKGKHLKGRTLMGGIVTPEDYDHFHELILNYELARLGTRGYMDGLLAGEVIGLPPVLNFGSPELQAKVVPEVLSGKKFICLAITEAFAGSDVAGLQTTAVRDGDEWVITGTKKWITNGTFADYFTVGCKTDTGFTVILIPRSDEVSTKAIKTAYSSTAGTAYVTFDKVRVPVANTLGQVGKGMHVILSNFNHERWMIVCTSLSAQRRVVEECMKWANQRVVFGKPLNAQPVIRAKLANMIARVEAGQNWLEFITHQMNNMSYQEQSDKLAGPIGLLKQFITRTGRETAEDATQIFGGRGITVTGMGKLVENYHRTSPYDAILGGAEDVLGDLGVRQAMKKMPKNARKTPQGEAYSARMSVLHEPEEENFRQDVENVHTHWMHAAMEMAEEALAAGEVPVGCIFVRDGKIIAKARNRTNELRNATRHAELEAIDEILADKQLTPVTREYPLSETTLSRAEV